MPYACPSTTFVLQLPGKKSDTVSDVERATYGSSGSSASSATNSGTHVLPSMAMSGVASPTNAVSSFSCAAVHGICCTRTRTPGFSRSNSCTSCATTSPSRPIAQSRMVSASVRLDDVHPADRDATSTRLLIARPTLSLIKPTSGETRSLQAGLDVGVRAHHPPDEPRAVVLDHRDDRSLVDAEVIGVEPRDAGHHRPGLRCQPGTRKRRVEGVEESVLREQPIAVFLAHGDERRDRDLRRERHRPAHRRR